jgi:ParB family transcriptional regulator, chromosome partitioning protein
VTTTRRGLGRGLGALIPTSTAPASAMPEVSLHEANDAGGLTPVEGASYVEIPTDRITPNPRQPRQVFDEEAMAELVASIREVGLLQPVVVRSMGEDKYELVMGERRWRAVQDAGLSTIPAILRETGEQNLLRDALIENLHRSQLNPLEEAAAYEQLLDDFSCTQEELSKRLGRSRPQISNTLRLLRLPAAVQRRVAAGLLSAGHARALLAMADPTEQEVLSRRIVAEGLSVRAVEEIVAVGTGEQPKPRGPRRQSGSVVAPRLTDLADRLSERFDTRVRVNLGKRKGRIVVEYASLDDLERIVAIMDPKAAANPSDQDS